MIAQAALGLPSAPQPWLSGSSPSDSCLGHALRAGTAFKPPTQPWEGDKKKKREERAGIIPCWTLCSVSRQCSTPEPAASTSPISCAQRLKTGLCCPNYPSLPDTYSHLFSIPPACPSSSYSLGIGLYRQAVHAQRQELEERRGQARDSGGHGSAQCLSFPWGVLQMMLSFRICFETRAAGSDSQSQQPKTEL